MFLIIKSRVGYTEGFEVKEMKQNLNYLSVKAKFCEIL